MALATLVYKNEVSDAEWETRCDLAALYRIFHNMRMTDLVYTHLSARVPDEPDCDRRFRWARRTGQHPGAPLRPA